MVDNVSFILRPYQQEMVNVGVAGLKAGKKPFVLQAATGAGKSLIIAAIAHQLDEPTLILQPSLELLVQNHAKMLAFGIDDVKVYSASAGSKEIGNFTMCTIGSIYKKPELFMHFKHVIIDEADCVNPKELNGMYTKFLNAINCKSVCGLTATPYRMVQKYIEEGSSMYYTTTIKMINRLNYPTFWSDIAYKIETQELIEAGYLSPIKYYIDNPDTRALKINSTGAEYTVESVEKFGMTIVARICQAIEYSLANHTKIIVFCSSLLQANRVLQSFEGSTARIMLVDGKTSSKERTKLVDEYKQSKEPIVMLNVGVFLAGFDVPDLDCVIWARPTMSLRVWYQAVGRGVRLDPNNPSKILTVYDLIGTTKRLGRVETIKIGVEDNGYKSMVSSEVGRLDEVMLSKFFVKNVPKHKR